MAQRLRQAIGAAALAAGLACPAMAQDRVMVESKAFEALVAAPPPAAPPARDEEPIILAHRALAERDYARAKALAEPLARKGDSAALHLLGYLYEKGLGVHADIGAALRHYGDAAIAGNADAQIALGVLAVEGDGVYPDYERAAGWFRLASAQGDPRGDVKLGLMFAEGVGVARDLVAATHHFAKAARTGDPDGEFFLGVAWMNGDGVPQSYDKAAKSFEAAAAQGHAEAAYHLALLYDSPALGAPDADKATKAMRFAAENNFPPAFAAMGLIVHRGDAPGVAADWFEKGARAGDPQAALLYAIALSKGDGRPKDAVGALSIVDQLLAARDIPDPLRGQAQSLRKSLVQRSTGPITLRD